MKRLQQLILIWTSAASVISRCKLHQWRKKIAQNQPRIIHLKTVINLRPFIHLHF